MTLAFHKPAANTNFKATLLAFAFIPQMATPGHTTQVVHEFKCVSKGVSTHTMHHRLCPLKLSWLSGSPKRLASPHPLPAEGSHKPFLLWPRQTLLLSNKWPLMAFHLVLSTPRTWSLYNISAMSWMRCCINAKACNKNVTLISMTLI